MLVNSAEDSLSNPDRGLLDGLGLRLEWSRATVVESHDFRSGSKTVSSKRYWIAD